MRDISFKIEILFRGFHKDENGESKAFVNGELVKGTWVYGFYVHYDDVLDCHLDDCDYIVERHNGKDFIFNEVITETVCQYTGLKDNNGKKIFESDIVDILNCEYIPWVIDKTKLKVEWCNDYTGFYPFCSYANYVDSENVEVIGNIFENPELLEVK